MEFINWLVDKDKSGLYIIESKIDSKVYIGQTKQKFKKRYYHHAWKLKQGSHDNKHLQKAFNKYGENNFTFKILIEITDFDKLNEHEVIQIELYRKLGGCYNMQSGGQVNNIGIMSEEGRKSVSEKNRARMLGSKLSEETKVKMSEVHKGNRYNEKNWIINDEIAFIIKSKLIKGEKSTSIAKELDISYKVVNAILSNDSWSSVKVEGWTDFRKNRKTIKRITKEERILIKKDYNDGMKINEIALKYERTRHAISYSLKKVNA